MSRDPQLLDCLIVGAGPAGHAAIAATAIHNRLPNNFR